MNNLTNIKDRLKTEMNLKIHSVECVRLFIKCLNTFEKEGQNFSPSENKPNEKIACSALEYDHYSMTLSILHYPNLNYGEQLLDNDDEKFFSTPQYLPYEKQQEIIGKVARVFDIKEDMYFDKIIANMNDIVYNWLSTCWQEANEIKGLSHPLYINKHNFENNTTKNLLDSKVYSLKELH